MPVRGETPISLTPTITSTPTPGTMTSLTARDIKDIVSEIFTKFTTLTKCYLNMFKR